MATFDFKCDECGAMKEDVILSIHHTDADYPTCHGPMRKYWRSVPQVHWKDYDLPDGGFRAQHDGTVITTRKQNLEYMERHGLQDANEVYDVPTFESEQQERAEAQAAIDAITPDADMIEVLKHDKVIDNDGNLITD